MPTISHQTYERLGRGVRYFNLHLGRQTDKLNELPALNPFKGVAVDDINEDLLATIETRLSDARNILHESDSESLAETLDVSPQNVELAREGVETALSAVGDARDELGSL